jgi:hypothetical protein
MEREGCLSLSSGILTSYHWSSVPSGGVSSNVRDLMETVVEYGVDPLGRKMAVTTEDIARSALRKNYKAQLSIAVWRGYANLLLDMTKYVGTDRAAPIRAHVRQEMKTRGDAGEHAGLWMAHETDAHLKDAFPSVGWGDCWGDALD